MAVGISSQGGDSSVMGQIMASINVTGEDILKINYSIVVDDSDVTYNLARMKEVDKDSPEYQVSSDKFRKIRRMAMHITLLKISGKSMRRAATVRERVYRL